VKWVLDVLIGGLWTASVYCLLDGLLKMKSSPKVLLEGLKSVRLFTSPLAPLEKNLKANVGTGNAPDLGTIALRLSTASVASRT
jgi:hypothetical protein